MQLEAFLANRLALAKTAYELAVEENDFAPNYYDYPEALHGLVKATAKLELALKRFNKDQAGNIGLRVDLSNIGMIKLDQFEALGIFIDFMWDEDELALENIFTTYLPDAIAAGGLMTQLEIGFPIDFSPADLPAQKFLERHIPQLAMDVNSVTRDRVKNSIRQGLLAGKSRDELASDLADVFDNPSRRRMIAQTESVRAFSEGRIQAGIEMGAIVKEWVAQAVRCPLCGALHGKQAPIAGTFPDGTYSPPRHPRCRCGQRLVFGKKPATPEQIAQRRQAYIDSLKVRFS